MPLDDVANVEGGVFAAERQHRIARLVMERGRARVGDLALQFGVSGVTIRKDLAELERQGRVVRTHGGAVSPAGAGMERAFEVRERMQRAEKDVIGREAAAMVADGESIALDASTTAFAMARHLRARGGWLDLTVVTNGLRIALELADVPGIRVLMAGGVVRPEALSLVGPLGEGLLERVNVHRAFLGAMGFSIEAGLCDGTEEEAQIKRLLVAAAAETVGLVDHSKWGRTALATFCPTASLGAVVTDARAPAQMRGALEVIGVRVVEVPGGRAGGSVGARAGWAEPVTPDGVGAGR
jgi:DeoR family transcriptional regulator of aga operon/DeoR family fructose operon transcriptional repressor